MSIQAGVLPELQIGVETPWPMKREGKQVYAKLIDFGVFPAPYGLKGKTHGIYDIEWGQISWDHSYVASSTDSRRRSLALVSTPATSGGTMPWRFQVDSTNVQVNMLTNTDYREWDTIVLCLLYTKSSEGAASGSLIAPGPDGQVLTSREGELMWEEVGGCNCDIARPDQAGQVPAGGLPGQVYGVSADGEHYGFMDLPSMVGNASKEFITESSTWTCQATGLYAVWCQGGGGGGGSVCWGNLGVAGGGSAGECSFNLFHFSIGQVLDCIVGSGGLGGTGSGETGLDGAGTTFGELLFAHGGKGGQGRSFPNDNRLALCRGGQAPGRSDTSLYSIITPGFSGSTVLLSLDNKDQMLASGSGGYSPFGKGGGSAFITSNGVATNGLSGTGYGAGGSGSASRAGVSSKGGNGAPGCIQIVKVI